jgi:hypothetical protein
VTYRRAVESIIQPRGGSEQRGWTRVPAGATIEFFKEIAMSSFVVRSLPVRLALSCIALAVLSACNRGADPAQVSAEPAELAWARSALERNPQLEVLASDSRTRVFTVRNRITGQVETVNLNDLAAAPLAQLRTQSAPPVVAAPAAAPEPVASAGSPVPATPATPAPEEQQELVENALNRPKRITPSTARAASCAFPVLA